LTLTRLPKRCRLATAEENAGALPHAASASFRSEASFRPFLIVGLFILMLVGSVLLGSERFVQTLTGEGGAVETLSAAGYLVAAAMLVREANQQFLKTHFYFVVILLALCMRELDFHNLMTTMSITKTSFYVSGDVPLLEKLAASVALATIGAAVVLAGLRHGRQFIAGLRGFHLPAVGVLAAGLSIIAAKTLDGLPRKLEGLGIDLGASAAVVSTGIEEVIELGIPLFLMCAVLAFFPRRHPQTPERGAAR
jgi:hypothetical protein